jgi:hypothetical protein
MVQRIKTGMIADDAVTAAKLSPDAENISVFRNRIINGAMVIDQRNAGAAVTADGAFPVDRFVIGNITDGAFSAQQDSSAPVGFVNSLKVTITTADVSLTTTQSINLFHRIEGYNTADLGWGTANAQTVTLSFWVRSSLTGNFGGSLRNSGASRSYPFTYSISSANTWEQKSITIAGDTSGTWLTTNGLGISVGFSLGSGPDRSGTAGSWTSSNFTSTTGATSVVGTNGATFYITGVQLELGSAATTFDFRAYGQELALCQRYYYRITPGAANAPFGNGLSSSSTTGRGLIDFPTTMRAAPSALEQSGTASDYRVFETGGTVNFSSVPTFITATVKTAVITQTVASNLVAGRANYTAASTGTAFLAWSAEL